MRRIARLAPPPRLDLDQCHCTAETKLRRVLALHEADALVGRRDPPARRRRPDLARDRACRAALGSAATIAQLAVVDVDPEVVASRARSELAGAPFPTIVRRCTTCASRCPRRSRRRSTPSSPTRRTRLAGAALFLSRAAEALDARGGDVFLSFGSRRPERRFSVQRAIGGWDSRSCGSRATSTSTSVRACSRGRAASTSSLPRLSCARGSAARYAGPLYTADVEPSSG